MNTFCKVVIALLTIAQLAIFFTSHSVLIPFMTFWIWCALVVPFALVGMLFRPRDRVVVVQAPAPVPTLTTIHGHVVPADGLVPSSSDAQTTPAWVVISVVASIVTAVVVMGFFGFFGI